MRAAIEPGYFVEYRSRIPGSYRHVFCGPHRIRGAVCPGCRRPFLRLLELDCRDPYLGALGLGAARVPLLFCWCCQLGESGLRYRLSKRGVELIGRPPRGRGESPYGDYPEAFPAAPARLIPMPSEVQGYIRALNGANRAFVSDGIADALAVPQHQVGGEPFLAGAIPLARCPACRRKMAFLATVCDACLDPRGFTGNPRMQLIYSLCRDCRILCGRPRTIDAKARPFAEPAPAVRDRRRR